MPSSLVSPTWSPLLEGALALRAHQALEAIILDLPRCFGQPGVANGEAGAALFFGYLDKAQPDIGWGVRSRAHLNQAAKVLEEEIVGPSLYSGFTGLAWTMDHLEGAAGKDPNEEIDEVLEKHLGEGPWPGCYDLIYGLVGYGLYGLDRVGRPSGRRILHRVIKHLDAAKTELECGLTWHTSPGLLPQWQRDLNPQGYFNLGLAHGVPAVIALLSQATAAGVDADRSLALLKGAVAWLLAQKNPEGSDSCFRTVVSLDSSGDASTSRIAWCYGDLGLSAALLWAARTLGQAEWEAEALAIARLAARRFGSGAGVRDAGLCHGAAGNAHIFNRLWQATGEELFRHAALAWIEETLAFREPGKGSGGFRAWRPDPQGSPDPWVNSEGFLEGSTGIGLVLMAALYPVLPEWDRILLVSLAPSASSFVGENSP